MLHASVNEGEFTFGQVMQREGLGGSAHTRLATQRGFGQRTGIWYDDHALGRHKGVTALEFDRLVPCAKGGSPSCAGSDTL